MVRLGFGVNLFSSTAFLLEFAAKIFAVGPHYYYKNRWNCFDFVIMVVSWLELAVTHFEANSRTAFAVFRFVRIGLVLRIARTPKLRTVFNSVLLAVPSLINISALLLLMFFIFTIVGMQLFGHVQIVGNAPLDRTHTNFQQFWPGLLTLARAATGTITITTTTTAAAIIAPSPSQPKTTH